MNMDYYTKREVLKILKPKQIRGAQSLTIGNRVYYKRRDVDDIISKFDFNNRRLCNSIIATFTLEDIDISEWVGQAEAQKILGISRQRLYQLKDANKISTVVFDGFMLFSKKDIELRCKTV